MKFPNCKCGGKAKYVDNGLFLDQYKCTKCDYTTNVYYDGALYAQGEWNRKMNPPPLTLHEKRLLEILKKKERDHKQ